MDAMTAQLNDYEIERGKPMPSKNHSKLQTRLATALSNAYGNQFDILSEISLEMPVKDRTPDLAIYPAEQETDWLNDEIKIAEPPLGVVEIQSPTQGAQELIDKIGEYFIAGVKSAWLVVLPFKTIYVFDAPRHYRTFTSEETLEDPRLGISLPLKEIFR